jgi:hypothetical protein
LTNRDLELTGSKEGKEVMITASDSMEDRFDPKVRRSIDWVVSNIQVGAIRSWDAMIKIDDPTGYTRDNMDEHYLTIIDNMVSPVLRVCDA